MSSSSNSSSNSSKSSSSSSSSSSTSSSFSFLTLRTLTPFSVLISILRLPDLIFVSSLPFSILVSNLPSSDSVLISVFLEFDSICVLLWPLLDSTLTVFEDPEPDEQEVVVLSWSSSSDLTLLPEDPEELPLLLSSELERTLPTASFWTCSRRTDKALKTPTTTTAITIRGSMWAKPFLYIFIN